MTLMQATMPEEQALEHVFMASALDPAKFAPFLVEAGALPDVQHATTRLMEDHGRFVGVTAQSGNCVVRLERADVPTRLSLDTQGRIAGLSFGLPITLSISISDAIGQIAQLPGQTSIYCRIRGREVAALNADKRMGVGSSFKILILRDIVLLVNAGSLSWDGIVHIPVPHPSLGSVMGNWPDGIPMTVASLVALVMSVSDNAATDVLLALIKRVGPPEMAASYGPDIPTTEQWNILRFVIPTVQIEAWRASDATGRMELLRSLPPMPKALPAQPDDQRHDIDYFLSARELIEALRSVFDDPYGRMGDGITQGFDFTAAASKGGATPTSANHTVVGLVGDCAIDLCVTWNHPAGVDHERFAVAIRGLLQVLIQEASEGG